MTGAESTAEARRRSQEFRTDLALAAGVVLVIELGVWAEVAFSPNPVPFPLGAYLLGLLAGAVLIFRRRHAVAVSVAVIVIVLVYHLVGYPGGSPGLALFVTSYSIAAYGKTVWSLVVALGFIVLWGVIPALPPHALPWYSFATTGPALGMAWMIVLGAAAGQVRRAHAQRLATASAEAESRMREQLAEERLSIARELHDVLAHTISVISVQTGVALDSLDENPDAAKAAMTKVRLLARQAMPELRGTLELLRRDPQDVVHTAEPQPGIAQLDSLVDEARATGLEVVTEIEPGVRQATLTPFTELTVYRIVQEALTNVIRHSGATRVTICMRIHDGELEFSVADNGHGAADNGRGAADNARGPVDNGGAAADALSAGLGLVGMRERSAAAGGTLRAANAAEGGFVVNATLPVVEAL